MESLLMVKEYIARFYTRFEAYIVPVLKFFAMLFALIFINSNVGFMDKLKNPAIVLILSLVCSFLPANVIVLVAGLVIVGHVYALSLECAVVVLFTFIIMYALYFRFTPRDAIAVLLTPVCFAIKLPYVMAFSMGLVGNPLSALSVGCGTIVYYILSYLKDNQKTLESDTASSLDVESALAGFKTVIDGLLKNEDMIVMVVGLAVIIVLVYVIRRLRINYSWFIAIGAGFAVGFIALLVANSALDGDVGMGGAFVSMLISALLCLVLQFFVFNVDYSRAEYVQFEDDEYYYYVKAVPKVTIGSAPRRARRNNSRNWDEEDEEYEY